VGRLAKASWPGWFTDQQLAGEYAQSLARQLAASVNAGQLAAAWLALHGTDTTQPASAMDEVAKARKRKRRRRRRSGGQQQPTAQPPPPQPVTSPRQFLIAQGVTAAISAIITSLLAQLWGAALTMGWASAVMVLGTSEIRGIEEALAKLLAAGQDRIAGIVQTRLSRLERVLLAALTDGIGVDELAQQIRDILGSLTSALLVTQSETTWASGWAAYWVYKLAGIKWVKWQTRNDGRVCSRCKANQAASPIRLGQKFPSGDKRPLAHPRCRCSLLPASAPKMQPKAA